MSRQQGRPRGFITDWNPHQETRLLVGAVNDIIRENDHILPLTIRQIFYMLVSDHRYDKTEKAYKRLCETLNKARRAQWVDMGAIRDDGLRSSSPHYYDDVEDVINAFHATAKYARLNRQIGQRKWLMLWCEAGGMLPQLAAAGKDYGVPAYSSGGFDSVTTKHDMARRISWRCEEYIDGVEILHIGDHDPSGVHMHNNLDEDLQAFIASMGGEVEVTRLAVTPVQIEHMNLPTAPPKPTDRRSFSGQTTQAEAIRPRDLRSIIEDAIETRIDRDAYDRIILQEAGLRADLKERLEDL